MRVPWGFLKRVLAGSTFGLYMAHLLYFLNPQIPITPLRLATLTLVYGIICGLLFGAILWLLRLGRVRVFGRPEGSEHRRYGFGLVVTAAFVSAAVYWAHYIVFRIYLPNGAVRILSKGTNILAGVAFLLLILWLYERSSSRNVSRLVLTLGLALIAVSSFFLYERRDEYQNNVQAVVVADVGTIAGERPVIVVAIPNLPHDWVVTLMGEGVLPFFEEVRDDAFFTRIEPFTATSPKAVWASLATGQLPFRHGVTGRYSYLTALNSPDEPFLILPSWVGFRAWGLIPPVERISAPLPAGSSLPFWSMFERVGLETAVINWPSATTDTTSAAALVSQQEVKRSAVAEALPDHLQVRFGGTGSRKPEVLQALATDRLAWDHALGAVRSRQFALTTVALNGLSEVQALFDLTDNALPAADTARGDAFRAYLHQIDSLLGQLREVSPEAIVVIVSPTGPHPPVIFSNPVALVKAVIDSFDPGRVDGFLAMTGQGVIHRDDAMAARIVDLAPTTLFAAGLPVPRDSDGRVVTESFTSQLLDQNPLSIIHTYDAEKLIVRRAGGN